MRYITAVPARNRDYRSARAVRKDWTAGRDFFIHDSVMSGYINRRNKPDGTVVCIMFRRLTRVTVIS